MPNDLRMPQLDTRYALGDLIGHGSQASVYAAMDGDTGESVVVKLYDPQVEHDKRWLAYFRRDARRACLHEHPNVIRTLSYGRASETLYVVMEKVDGGSLAESRRTFSQPEGFQGMLQVSDGLDYLHRHGTIHGNIKPTNILFRHNGDAVLTDAGVAPQLVGSDLAMTSVIVGSVHYQSPDQLLGQAVNRASDIYSFGVLLYEVSTGHLPFAAANPVVLAMQQLREKPIAPSLVSSDVSPELEAIILRCLEKDPQDRFETMAEVGEALRATTSPDPAVVSSFDTTPILTTVSRPGVLRGRPIVRERISGLARMLRVFTPRRSSRARA